MEAGIGVDGCKAGWFGVKLRKSGKWETKLFSTIEQLHMEWGELNTPVLIDVPIGLPDITSYRQCESEARSYLPIERKSSIFNPPTRAALNGINYQDAALLNELACGKRISKQTWAIMPKIREVDSFITQSLERQRIFREIHPEVLFQALNYGKGLVYKKNLASGQTERIRILNNYTPYTQQIFDYARSNYLRRQVQLDDVLDAVAAAVVALMDPSRLSTMPPVPQIDSEGVRCELVYPIVERSHGESILVEVREEHGEILWSRRLPKSSMSLLKQTLDSISNVQ